VAVQFGIATLKLGTFDVGLLQNTSIEFSYEIAQLYSGNKIFPVDVRVHTGTISGTAEYAELTAEGMEFLIGGSRATNVLTLISTDSPGLFALEIEVITDAITFTMTFNSVRSTKFALAFARDGHLIPNFDFNIEANSAGDVAVIDVGA